jgi:O-antigen/teichoic acid export membrane protein
MVMRSDLRRALGANSGSSGAFSLVRLKPVLGYASGMMAMSVIAGVNTQLDRLVVSRLRPLDEFSYYSLAATLSQIPTVVTMPIAMALLPRFTALNEAAQHATLRQLYELNTYLIATCSSIAAFVLVFFAHDVMSVWMHGQEIPTVVVPVIQLLSMGGLFLALQLTPFQLSLANGHNRTNVRLGAVALVITIPMQVIFTSRYGVVGAAIPWLALNAFAFAYLGVVLNRRFNEGHARDWFVECTMVPVLISGASLCFARIATDWLGYSAARACIVATLFCLVGAAIAFATWPSVRRRLEHA